VVVDMARNILGNPYEEDDMADTHKGKCFCGAVAHWRRGLSRQTQKEVWCHRAVEFSEERRGYRTANRVQDFQSFFPIRILKQMYGTGDRAMYRTLQ